MAAENIVVLVTCDSTKEAQRLAKALVRKRLAACVSIQRSPIESLYWWAGKVETAREVLLLVKTARKKFGALEKETRRLHSYETPEIIALPIVAGSAPYLKWIHESLKA